MAFLAIGDAEFDRAEAEALAGLRHSPAWPMLVRVMNSMMSEEASRVMLGKAPSIETVHESRGRYAALADVIGMVEKAIPEKFIARVAEVGDTE